MDDKTDDWDRRHPGPPAMPDKERKAAEDMRERAARLVESEAPYIYPPAARKLAAAIRALKVGE